MHRGIGSIATLDAEFHQNSIRDARNDRLQHDTSDSNDFQCGVQANIQRCLGLRIFDDQPRFYLADEDI